MLEPLVTLHSRIDAISPFIRFLVTGGIAALLNIAARILLSTILSFEVAVVVAYLIGMSAAYILARQFVFGRSGQTMKSEYARFALVNAVAIVQVWVVSVSLRTFIFPAIGLALHPELFAHVIAVLSPAVTSYYGHRFFTFRLRN